jgi:DNA invertase Pin-like site-specific DNA recombinase
LENQRSEIKPFIERRGWQLGCAFEDVVSGGKTEKDRPGFAAMLKAAHQRKFDVLIFWALDRLTRVIVRSFCMRLVKPRVDTLTERWLAKLVCSEPSRWGEWGNAAGLEVS